MYHLTLDFPTLAEFQAFAASINGAAAAPNASPPATGKGAKGAATSPSPSPAAPSPAAAPAAAPAVAVKKYDDTQIGAKLKKAVEAGKKDAALKLLTQYEAMKDGKPSGQGLKPDQFEKFEADLDALLAPPASDDIS